MTTPTQKFAAAIKSMTYTELDELSLAIGRIAVDDHGNPNDPRYIATALIEHCEEIEDRTNE